MKYLKILVFLLFAFTTTNAVAQKTSAEKILGCWTFKKIEFNGKYDFSEELILQTQNTVVCFNANGKFITTNAKKSSEPINGSYKIADDGKTLSQKRDLSDEGFDEDAEIEFLNDENLIFKLEFGTMYFERK
ncbi:hypothetical protein [Flavobacterium sp. 102]|uniref:hypothetical protein n=1 Tax=Flavobacterium sp. 102 TaxID=2135623 RepID=UPI000EAD74A1|nr:hypothetical protein [Flavobacterium sp. 102]RKS03220.1 hypothetical protein C8C84_2964 [Flavobacterium sp. 102]